MKRKKKVKKILNILKEEYPEATTTLEYGNPLEMLIATILSAQSTDKTVNKVTNKLFEKYQGLEDYLDAEKKDLEEIIYPTGFYKKKAEYIKKSCKIIAEEYDCQVPDNMEELLELPGVGRKTANIVLGNSFEKLEGIPVDTHAKRLSKRLGLTDKKYANKIEYIGVILKDQPLIMSFGYKKGC